MGVISWFPRGIPVLFGVVFAVVFVCILVMWFTMIRTVRRTVRQNDRSPRLTVEAMVVGRRTDVSHYHRGDVSAHSVSSYSTYYVTFEVESGDRMELCVSGQEYGMLIEGDRGRLTFQGTRFLDFQRI